MTQEEFLNDIRQGKHVSLHTDGACSGNPGPGGWGAVYSFDSNIVFEISGFDKATTNNRMEMMAAIEGLKLLPEKTNVTLYTDSQYVKNGVTIWMQNWKKNNWQTSKNSPVKNQDLWLMFDELVQKYNITWQWVKGHSGDVRNDKADSLARQAIITAHMQVS